MVLSSLYPYFSNIKLTDFIKKKIKESTWHKRATKKKAWVSDGNRTHDIPNTGQALYAVNLFIKTSYITIVGLNYV